MFHLHGQNDIDYYFMNLHVQIKRQKRYIIKRILSYIPSHSVVKAIRMNVFVCRQDPMSAVSRA